MPGQSPRDFAEWMQKIERQSKAALRHSSYAAQTARDAVVRVDDVVPTGTPTAPVEITHQTSLYKNTSGAWRARLDVDFPDVTLTVDQKPITVSGYELYGYEVELYAESEPVWEQYGGSDTSSITRMDLPPAVEYMMKVRAVGGVWSSEFRVFTTVDTVPPPQPTAPTAEVFLGAITVKWDKKAVTGDMPSDFEAAILCVGEEPSPGLDKAVTRFDMHESTFVITGANYYKPVFIRLIAVDTSGNLSQWSEQVTAMTKPLVDADIILGEIDAGKVRIINASQMVLESGAELGQKLQEADTALAETEKKLSGPGGLTERLTGAEALLEDAGSLTYADGQTLRQKLTAADTAISTAQGQLDTVRGTTLPKLVQDLGAAEGRISAADIEISKAFAQITQTEDVVRATNDLIAQAIASGQSLVLNGSFEAGMAGWQQNAGGEVLPEAARSGVGGMRITPASGNAWPLNRDVAASTGRTYYAEMWVRRTGNDTWSTQAIGFCAQPKLADGSWGDAVVFRPEPVDGKDLTAGDIPADRFVKISAEVTLTQEDVNVVSFAPWFYQSADNIYDVDDMLVIDVTEARELQSGLTAAEASIKAVADQISPLEKGLDLLNKTTIPGLVTSIDGKTATIRKTAAPTASDLADPGTRWEVWTSLGVGGKLTATYRRAQNGGSWIQDVLSADYLPLVDIGAGTFGTLSGGRMEVGSLSADKVLIGVGGNLIANGTGDWGRPGGWSSGLTWNTNNHPPGYDGSFISNGGTYVTTGHLFDVEPGAEYLFEVWVKASKAGSRIFFELRNQLGDHGAAWRSLPGDPNGTANATYPVTSYEVPTSWTKLTAIGVPNADTTQLKLGSIYFNHSNGTVTDATQHIAGLRVSRRVAGSLIVSGTITGDHVAAESVAAKIGTFVKINVENITATATANLNSVVAQRIAAGTASFQTVDAKNLFVTGTSSLSEVVAKRLAAETGEFIKLSVDQLIVSGTANMAEVVANRMFANIFATNRLTASQILIGEGGNLFADPNFLDPDGWSSGTILKNGGRNGNNALAIAASTSQAGSYYGSADRNRQFAVIPGASYKISAWVKPDAAVPINGVALYMKWTTPSSAASGSFTTPGNISNKEALKAGVWAEVSGVVTVSDTAVKGFIGAFAQASANTRVLFSEPGVVQAVDQGLIVDNGILARHITASEEMSAKIGSFLKLDVGSLTATGTSNLATAVVENLWANVVRAKQITTDMLTVGSGPNAIADPFFDSADLKSLRASRAGGWGGWSRNSSLNLNWYGASGLAATVSNSFYYDTGTTYDAGNMIAVEPGQKWLFKVKVNSTASGPRATARLLNKDGTTSYSASYWEKVDGGSNGYDPTGVQDFERIFTVPDTVAYMVPAVQWPNATTAAYVYGGASFINMSTPSLIVDGAITTKKLTVTQDMTAALLKAKKVEAIEIDVNSLKGDTAWIGSLRTGILVTDVVTSTHIKSDSITADLLKADAITSKHTLTGPLIRSAASGARTEMTNQGIRVLNSSNVELVRMGYGIGTGMSIRHPGTGTLTPLAPVVFGIDYTNITTVHNTTPVGNSMDSYSNHSNGNIKNGSADFTFTALTTSVMFFWDVMVQPNIPFDFDMAASRIQVPFSMLMTVDSGTMPVLKPGEGWWPTPTSRFVPAIAHLAANNFSAFAVNVGGMSVHDGLVVGQTYKVKYYINMQNRIQASRGSNLFLGALNCRLTDIRLVMIPR